jgi:transcriptional regulator GlxA family with amidase domain
MTKREVALIIHDGVQALDVAGPLDVFAEANGFLPSDEAYDCLLLAADTNPVRASNGVLMIPHFSFARAGRRFDIVLVAGGPSLPEAQSDKAMLDWLRNWGTLAGRYGSICTGAFVLGHAGLLDGRVATTHWQNAAQLAASFPACRVEYDRIHARDGALVTSAGVTAGIDLALARARIMARRRHSPAPGGWWSSPSARAASRSSVRYWSHEATRIRRSARSRPMSLIISRSRFPLHSWPTLLARANERWRACS